MARFPLKEAEIAALAGTMIAGLTANPGVFTAPPVAPVDLQTALTDYTTARDASVAAQAAARQAITAKDFALQTLTDAMKDDLRYAEITVDFDDAQLQLIGWKGRAASTALAAPGQCRVLEAPRQGEGWVFLDWKEPIDGGAVAAYSVQRRERPSGLWSEVGTAVISEITLTNQERNKEWEYRVLAVNKAGQGAPSNSVLAVL